LIDLFKIGFVIVAIIVLIRVKVPLSITLIASSIVLGILFHLPLAAMRDAIWRGVADAEALKLVIALELVLLFSAIMKERGSMTRAISALSQVFRDARVTVAIIPAVIGLLPVVGGAMLSAPLVAEASDDLALSPERRTFLNFWFRHVWEYTLPTFPAVFLTAGIVGIPIADLVLVNLPLTAASILAGVVFGFKGVRPFTSAHATLTPGGMGKSLLSFVWNLLPFFLVILLTLCFDIHLVYSLALVAAGTVLLYRIPPALLGPLVRKNVSLELACLIWGIMFFKEMLTASSAMNSIASELSRMGMPTAVLVALIPAVIAFITGYTTAFVGLSFPVLLPLLPTDGSSVYYVMLALASGIGAHMLSPMHACYVMTLEYYQAGMGKTYRLLRAPALLTFLTGVAVFLAATWLTG
jgi:hypothetical protein